MNAGFLLIWMLAAQAGMAERQARIAQYIEQIAKSGRVLEIGEDRLADPRRQIAPGAPPILSFRYFQGADRHRFGNMDVMLDDAGH